MRFSPTQTSSRRVVSFNLSKPQAHTSQVLHGADSDVVWLQQDFNLYLVNMFDTFHASKVLEFPRHGLAALLEMYCDFSADKRYQLADWRIRCVSQIVASLPL